MKLLLQKEKEFGLWKLCLAEGLGLVLVTVVS